MSGEKLRDFVQGFTRLVDSAPDEARAIAAGGALLRELVAQDDWLPAGCALPDAAFYRQYLLHCDPLERFSVVSFVWGPGQVTPVHNHTVWGLVGMLRGFETAQDFARAADGRLVAGARHELHPGMVAAVSPTIGDIHTVGNGLADRASISIHVYGGNIGRIRRAVFDRATGAEKLFISGYSNDAVPNIWQA